MTNPLPTTTPELEAAARAVCVSCNAPMRQAASVEAFDAFIDLHWKEYVGVARAALSAIREPTERMTEAANKSGFEGSDKHFAQDWKAVIDSILTDTRTPTEGESL